jgi:ATP diphosphatase
MSDQKLTDAFLGFVKTIAALRHPKTGCPWDLEQDHKTLRRYMIEEAYEAADAMASGDDADIKDELGDVLLQVVLNAQIAQDHKTFNLESVIKGIDDKMRRRHPHVFGDVNAESSKEVLRNWDGIKAAEKAAAGKKDHGIFAEAHNKQPATTQALKIGKLAAKIKFDWDDLNEVFGQLRSEVDELQAEVKKKPVDAAKLAEEIGDVYFSLAQVCRHAGLDPETVSFDANRKFLKRFERLEAIAKKRGVDVKNAPRATLEELWVATKKEERS